MVALRAWFELVRKPMLVMYKGWDGFSAAWAISTAYDAHLMRGLDIHDVLEYAFKRESSDFEAFEREFQDAYQLAQCGQLY